MKGVLKAILIFLFVPLLFFACATTPKETSQRGGSLSVVDISAGLPTEGLWRENLILYDMNGDGFLDIVTPPPRKAKQGQSRPFVFVWDASQKRWTEGKYTFPGKGYTYGAVAVGDLNGDNLPDVALAQHQGRIVLFMNDNGKGFVESPLPFKEEFHSRAIVLSDINGDGRPDIIAVSEAPFSSEYQPRGILVGINKGGGEWDISVLKESLGQFADFVAVGDLTGSGNKDIAVATLTPVKEMQKLVWLGDGKGGFKHYTDDLLGDNILPVIVKTGDVDGDGRNEAAFGLALTGGGVSNEKGRLAVLKWMGAGFKDISSGLDDLGYLVAFDLADIYGDGRSRLVVLTETGLHIYRYSDPAGWKEEGNLPVPMADVSNVTDLRAGRNKDGSVVIVYNLGKYETAGLNQGLKAFMLK